MENWQHVSDSIKGIERGENKDRIIIIDGKGYLLAVLFDGISAAAEANKGIDIAVDFIKQNHQKIGQGNYNLSALMFDAHQKIVASNLNSPFSTYSAAYIPQFEGTAFFSNIGDSRIYEITPQYIKQLSHDDNLINNKNIVTKYLGMIQLNKDQIENFSAATENKRFLLCSDGFYSFIEHNLSRFHEIFNFKRSLNIKKSLVREIRNKNIDDSSYILIKIHV